MNHPPGVAKPERLKSTDTKENAPMNLQGKKINFLGDSITEGYGVSCESARYTNLIAEKYGAVCRLGGKHL